MIKNFDSNMLMNSGQFINSFKPLMFKMGLSLPACKISKALKRLNLVEIKETKEIETKKILEFNQFNVFKLLKQLDAKTMFRKIVVNFFIRLNKIFFICWTIHKLF